MPIIDSNVSLEGGVVPGVNDSVPQLSDLLRLRGIERAILVSARAAQVCPIAGNQMLKSALEQTPGMYGCLAAQVNRMDASLQAIRELLGNKRFVAVLLMPLRPDQPLNPLEADDILNACRRFQKPIFVLTPNAACVQTALHLAKTYAMHRFVFVGMGGADWRAAIEAAAGATNVFLETSGSLDRNKIPAAVERIGGHRVLFGSGLPVLDPAAALGLVQDANLSSMEQRRVLQDNAYKLFGLEDIEAS